MEMQRLRRSNFYSECPLDRADYRRQDEAWLAGRLKAKGTRFVALWQNRNLVDKLEGDPPRSAVFLDRDHYEALADLLDDGAIFLGEDTEKHSYFAIDLAKLELPDHHPVLAGLGHFADLRLFGPMLPQGEGALLAYARGMIYWHRRHRFCGLCGAPTRSERGGHLRRCTNPACGASHFPRTDPAVIMVVHDGGDRCVLGRQANWPSGMHSTLAGFVEPGESLEEAVAREVEEEVGLKVTEVTYHSSQPWPFPSSLMIGFWARAQGDALRVDETEIERAAWYSRAELIASPEDESFRLPRRDSIARRLIEDWLSEIG